MRFPVWILLAGLTAGCCIAQDATPPKTNPVKTCPLPGVAGGVSNELTIKKGMPYHAKRVVRCEETLADGTVVKNKESSLEWRDSLGRVRSQSLDGSSDFYRVQVSDPVAHVWWSWDVGKGSSHQTFETKYKYRHEFAQWPTDFDFGTWAPSEGPTFKDVRLDPKWVNGVYAKGDLILKVDEPGQDGNDTNHLSGETSESWLSVDLGEIVKWINTSASANRMKDMMDLYVLDRLEPDPGLFKPPAGNEILETKPMGDGVDESASEEPSDQARQPSPGAPAKTGIAIISPARTTTVTPAHTAPPEH